MYFYRLGYWTYDGSAGVELAHPERFAPAEFERLVHEAVAELLGRERKRQAHFPFAWIYDQVAALLVARHGFTRLEYTADYEIYGSGSILDGDPNMPDLERLTAFLRERGLTD